MTVTSARLTSVLGFDRLLVASVAKSILAADALCGNRFTGVIMDVANEKQQETVDRPSVYILATLSPKLNLAFHQNSLPALHELVIVNDSDVPLKEVELALSADPPFMKSKTWRIDVVGKADRYRLQDLDVSLDGAFFARLGEAEKAQAVFSLKVCGEETTSLTVPIELLARNQWGGIGHMPDMVAAFVQPNDPAVERLLKKTADVLRQHGKVGALSGYEGGPKRAWELTSAIWTAISALGLDYALPPASFEHAGQKIRGPGQIIEAGLATCLDTALLFAAVLEQCGLNPLIVFAHGHAFAGVWLKAEEFSTSIVDDVTALRKRVKLNELALFETTLVTHRPSSAFSHAIERGAHQISEAVEHTFELAVDIRRARLQRIKPLANTETVATGSEQAAAANLEPSFEEAPDMPDEDISRPDEAKAVKPESRLDRWQRKLLDLSLRNSLLNFRATKSAIKFDAPDPGRLEDLLADGRILKLLPRPDLMDGDDPRSQAIHEARTNEDLRRAHALDALERSEVFVSLNGGELETRLIDLYRTARASLQEGGSNTLFLALGFLSWTRDDKDDKRYRAPLVLIPVTLNRKSVRSGFTLSLHDDEPRFNPTLLEMLRQDFKLTIPVSDGELAKDDSGLDIAGIWKSVSLAVKDIKGWEVVEDVVLATYSFAKYLMWKDLVDRTEQIKQNPVVRHLIDTPRDPYPNSVPFANPRELDETHGPEKTFCPLPADSSQLSAVMAAVKGKDFVLIGPPGTGKSQTIANLISQCMAERKTVLFVSEKIAALDVVYRRLREVGLGDFCLELHSNKARKLDVLDQLRQAWETKGNVDAQEWLKEAQRLKAVRDQLNAFVRQLHLKRRNGLTSYVAIGRILSGRDSPGLGLSWPSADAHDVDALDALRELAERLDVNASEVGAIAGSPLAPLMHGEWSPNWQQSLVKTARELLPLADRVEEAAGAFCQATSLPDFVLTQRAQKSLATLSRVLPDAAGHDWRFVLRPDVGSIAEELREGVALVVRHREVMGQISAPYSGDVIRDLNRGIELLALHRELVSQLSVLYLKEVNSIDVYQLQTDLTVAEKSWWPMNWLRHRHVRSALISVMDGQGEPHVAADIARLVKLRELESEIDGLDHLTTKTGALWSNLATQTDNIKAALAFQAALTLAIDGESWSEGGLSTVADGRCGSVMATDLGRMRELRVLEKSIADLIELQVKTGGLWTGLKSPLDKIDKVLAFKTDILSAIVGLGSTTEKLAAIKAPLDRLLGDGNVLLEPAGQIRSAGKSYREAWGQFQQTADTFAGLIGVAAGDMPAVVGETPELMAQVCRGILPLEPKLRAWCAWRKARGAAVSLGLGALVAGIENGGVTLGKVRDAFEIDYCRWWLNGVVDADDVLRNFVSAEHEKRIADFRMLDDRFTELTRSYVRAGLCADLPDQDGVGKTSEWGILRHEMQKKKRHMPLRELMNRVPNTLTKLTPCLLMSPLSIAQYLSSDAAIFDVVVFDEASQIPVWDAVGAIARGKQVVMVGDPKQLPPTNFFDRAESELDDEDIEGDLESILDECLGANLPMQNLSWHYRSRHESLIAFSNHRYYGGGLVTFPSPVTDDRAVSFHMVRNGVYEKGGARINKPEARALVADIVARLKDPVFKSAGLTIGVVTFNSEQQRSIEDLLDEERRMAPSIEPFFAEGALEPVFVKNLESVQGDERDIMYFSITYGPDISGAVSMNFGPMNRDGGERRLNVAVTRARHELRVFSSLTPDQFDLSRTQASGVRDLKHFLDFAQRGPRALAEAALGSIGDYESPFEQMVSEALARKNWLVHPQVGVSSFRIDLGVVDPDAPGRYLAGIECDGATYHRSATARDRDKLREQVLRGLGWEILRIWSTDWWINAPGALEKVHVRLSALLDASRARRAEEERRKEESENISGAETDHAGVEDIGNEADTRLSSQLSARHHNVSVRQPAYARNEGLMPEAKNGVALFREADPASVVDALEPDAFFDRAYDGTLHRLVAHVVEMEGPVREDVLARRIARAHGWARTGTRICERVVKLAKPRFPMTTEDVGLFFWPCESDVHVWATFRRPSGNEARSVDEIAMPELVALARELRLRGLDGEDVIAVMAHEMGLQRLRAVSRERLALAWKEASSA